MTVNAKFPRWRDAVRALYREAGWARVLEGLCAVLFAGVSGECGGVGGF